MTIYGYARVSSISQSVEEKTSLSEQDRKIRGAAMVLGSDDPIIFNDPGVSGSIALEDRPEGGKLWRLLNPGDTFICAKLDRLFRSTSDALVTADLMKKRGISLILVDMGTDPVTDGGVSRLFFTMLAAFAEFEKNKILERMSDGKRAKKANGGHVAGRPPYGFSVTGKGKSAMLVRDEKEQAVIEKVNTLVSSGMSVAQIVRSLTNEGLLSRSGMPFVHMQVRRIIK